MVMYLLDTNMVSYIVKGRSLAASDRLVDLSGNEVAAVSAITVAEIRYGLAKNPEGTALRSLMDNFLASIQVLPWGTYEPKPTELFGPSWKERHFSRKHGHDDCRSCHRR